MQVWNVLHAARWKCRTQKSPKICHLGTIAQLCRAMSSQLRHVLTIEKKPVKQQYLLHMSSQYGELRSWKTVAVGFEEVSENCPARVYAAAFWRTASLRRARQLCHFYATCAVHKHLTADSGHQLNNVVFEQQVRWSVSSSGCQPKFAALNRGRHLQSTGRPSRWALANILVDLLSTNPASVLWHCWLGIRKSIWHTKFEWWCASMVIFLKHGAEWSAYGPADATATTESLASLKSTLV